MPPTEEGGPEVASLYSSLKWADNFYICSFSNRTIVYKGMVRSVVLGDFIPI
jgi:glutamate synthase (ferredoxin)